MGETERGRRRGSKAGKKPNNIKAKEFCAKRMKATGNKNCKAVEGKGVQRGRS